MYYNMDPSEDNIELKEFIIKSLEFDEIIKDFGGPKSIINRTEEKL